MRTFSNNEPPIKYYYSYIDNTKMKLIIRHLACSNYSYRSSELCRVFPLFQNIFYARARHTQRKQASPSNPSNFVFVLFSSDESFEMRQTSDTGFIKVNKNIPNNSLYTLYWMLCYSIYAIPNKTQQKFS